MHAVIRAVLWLFVTLSAVGLGLCVVAHVVTFFASAGPPGDAASLLVKGLFVVWLPTVLVATYLTRAAGAGVSRRGAWEAILRGCPPWVPRAIQLLGVYAVMNFVWLVVRAPKHGDSAAALHGLSGHLLIFYAAALATFYSALHLQRRLT